MSHPRKIALTLSVALAFAGAAALAQPPEHRDQPRQEGHPGPEHPGHPEPHQGPRGYQRPEAPQGWNNRPREVDRGAYQHNFQASHTYRIGPYHRPEGWHEHRWVYGEVLPRPYWAPEYLIGDYWLFGLEVPPVGYEWVRDGADALLINTADGTILQVEYGVFA